MPKCVIAIFIGLLLISEGLIRLHINSENTISADSLIPLVEKLQQFIVPTLAISLVYIIIVIIFALKDVDVTERYKLNLYILSFCVCLLAGFAGFHFQQDNALIFTVQHAIISLFAILMTYFHWPYEVKKDLIYDEQNHDQLENKAEEAPFMINEDSDN